MSLLRFWLTSLFASGEPIFIPVLGVSECACVCVCVQEGAHYCWYQLINFSTHTFKEKKKLLLTLQS